MQLRLNNLIWIIVLLLFPSALAVNEILGADRSFSVNQITGLAYDTFNDTLLVAKHPDDDVIAYAPDGTLLWTCDVSSQNIGVQRGITSINETHFAIMDGDVAGEIEFWSKGAACVFAYSDSLNGIDTRGIWIASNGSDEYLYSVEIGGTPQVHRWKKHATDKGYEATPDASFNLPSGSTGRGAMFNSTQGTFFYVGVGGNTGNISRFNDTGIFGADDNYGKQLLDPTNSVALSGLAINVTLNGSIQFFYGNVTSSKVYQASLNVSTPVITPPSPPDLTPPNIEILSPVNNSVISVNFVDLNWTSNETVNWCVYSLDGGENNTDLCGIQPPSSFSTWKYRSEIILQNNYSINMDEIPVRINVIKDLPDFDTANFKNDGSDIRFTDNQNNNLTSFVEIWNEVDEQTIVWVNVTIPSDSNITIFMYYANDNAKAKNIYDGYMGYENFTAGTTPQNWTLRNTGPGVAKFNEPFGINTYGTDITGVPPQQNYSALIECTGTGGDSCDALRFKPFEPKYLRDDWSFNMNYTVDFYYYVNSSDGLVEHGNWFDGGVAIVRWDNTEQNMQPKADFGCINSSGDEAGINVTDKWNRIQIIRQRAPEGSSDKSLNHTKVRFYVDESLFNQCNGTQDGFGLEDLKFAFDWRLHWSISHGADGNGKLRIDNFKFYKNFGWNTSDVTLYANNKTLVGNRNITLTSLSLGEHNVTIWANDTSGNMGQSDTIFWNFVETTPPEITLINLTSEGGLGQIIDLNNKQGGQNRTNDTTPTFFIKTNENSNCAVINNNSNLNYSDITAGSSECATTGTTIHICSLPDENKTAVGFNNFSIGCQDSFGNENLTSTSGKFLINTIEFEVPTVSFSHPTLADNSITSNLSIMINVTTTGAVETYTLDWDGINETVVFNITSGILINKTGLLDSTSYTYRVYVEDIKGTKSSTEERTVSTNTLGILLSVSAGAQLAFRPTVENATLRTENISCTGQNNSIGCLNVTTLFEFDLNFSLLFNITVDSPNQRIIEDFSVDALDWTVFQLRSNNTLNKTILNASVTCGEIQSLNSTGLIEYRFDNNIETVYTNSSNESVLINTSVNCTNVNYFTRILNGTQKNITGFDAFNFSWKGDNSSNTFSISLFDDDGTKASSSTLTLSNVRFNTTGISLGSLTNISIINITVTNVSGTSGLSGFFIDNLRLMNLTSTQSSNIRMKANCGPEYHNATLLVPDVWTSLCVLQRNTLTKYIWLWQDINLTKKGISWLLQYNATKVI